MPPFFPSAGPARAVRGDPPCLTKGRHRQTRREFKTKGPGTATLPTARPGMQQTTLGESPRAVAFKITAGPDFQEPAGTTHEYDQVVIALGPSDMSLAVDGKAPVTKWQRIDVQFIGRGVKHESKNTSGKSLDYIIVAIR